MIWLNGFSFYLLNEYAQITRDVLEKYIQEVLLNELECLANKI